MTKSGKRQRRGTPEQERDELIPSELSSREEMRAAAERLLGGIGRRAAPPAWLLVRLGLLIDLAGDLAWQEALGVAILAGDRMLKETGTERLDDKGRALVHYFLSNAYESLRQVTRTGAALGEWEQPELERVIVHLRHAVRLGEGAGLEKVRICQLHTNLANWLSQVGRLPEALVSWDAALAVDPRFAMALGNKGSGLIQYARALHDPGHQVVLLRAAWLSLDQSLRWADKALLHPEALAAFGRLRKRVEEALRPGVLRQRNPRGSWRSRMPAAEKRYRLWCLQNRLFLNDLNDLGPLVIAAADVTTLPSVVTKGSEGPGVIGFFNQLKQEFVTARYLYYEGVTAAEVQFADRDVTLINTLDYPAYGIGIERVRAAFRIGYSLLDKVAFFLNSYLGLRIPEKRVYFRGLWYEKQERVKGLRADVHRPDNAALRALFWLAKDLYEDRPGFREALAPEARDIAAVRNHLEHKYVKVHDLSAGSLESREHLISAGLTDQLAHSVSREAFERQALWVLGMARAALLHLSMAVRVEEARKAAGASGGRAVPMYLDAWDDEWKV